MMTYDYGGHWDNTATHNSPLTAQKESVEHLLRKPDCTAEKLNLGMGAYGCVTNTKTFLFINLFVISVEHTN